MRVRVTYATNEQLANPSSQIGNPFGSLTMTIEGPINIVANWIDENIIAGQCAMIGDKYRQTQQTGMIRDWLKAGGAHEFHCQTLFAEHIIDVKECAKRLGDHFLVSPEEFKHLPDGSPNRHEESTGPVFWCQGTLFTVLPCGQTPVGKFWLAIGYGVDNLQVWQSIPFV